MSIFWYKIPVSQSEVTLTVFLLQETQDLGELVKLCRDFDPASGAQHPVQIITRCPFLAMRYPKSIDSVRINGFFPSAIQTFKLP